MSCGIVPRVSSAMLGSSTPSRPRRPGAAETGEQAGAAGHRAGSSPDAAAATVLAVRWARAFSRSRVASVSSEAVRVVSATAERRQSAWTASASSPPHDRRMTASASVPAARTDSTSRAHS